MTSLYSINYHTRAHKRDAFIEFIKSLCLTPFVLHTRPSTADDEYSVADNRTKSGTAVPRNSDAGGPPEGDRNVERYCEILQCVEELIADHMSHQDQDLLELSRLSTLVPSIGRFFTFLPLKASFMRQDAKRSIAARRFVPPSFNDVRAILNDAQVTAIGSTIKLITFDGDMTLYADGADFARDSQLVLLIVELLQHGLHVAIVTAAGYPRDAPRYEKRLSGLLDGFRGSGLPGEALERFYVLGGECNYLFRYESASGHLRYIDPEVYQPESVKKWSNNAGRITEMLDIAQSTLEQCAREMGLEAAVGVLRKDRAIGVVPNEGTHLTRETLDEFALSAQRRLNNFQRAQYIRASEEPVPFCAFNGGSDVWVDIGNKLIGVQMLQEFLGTTGNQTLHVGDQFLSTGNDISTRTACCTVWITNPEETAEVLTELCKLLQRKNKRSRVVDDEAENGSGSKRAVAGNK
ncbi:IMP 5'-nucleotidase [Thoreauomyces humboldtii]|nr:IMP 5'-nucleotidase [Thoreauomyces humboldtii]